MWAHWYTEAEAEECLSHSRPGLAATFRFAVKEATYKAVGAQFSGPVRWRDIEVLEGEPAWHITLHGEMAAAAADAGAEHFHVSTCQTGGRVVAMVIAQGGCADRERATPSYAYAATQTTSREQG